MSNNQRRRIFCGVTGGTASGKTTFCRNILKQLPSRHCVIISQDNYYKNIPKHIDKTTWNWDIPEALEWDLLAKHLKALKDGEDNVKIPDWDFVKHERKSETVSVEDADIYLIEGIFVLTDPAIRDLLDLKIFVKVDDDTRLSRRIKRDMNDRGRTLDSILYQYDNFVKPGFDNYTFPSQKHATIIVPYQERNPVAEDVVVNWITKLEVGSS